MLLEQPEDPFTTIIEQVGVIAASLKELGSVPVVSSTKRPSEASSQQYLVEHNIGQIFEVRSLYCLENWHPIDTLFASLRIAFAGITHKCTVRQAVRASGVSHTGGATRSQGQRKR
jgi:hypothetical protein